MVILDPALQKPLPRREAKPKKKHSPLKKSFPEKSEKPFILQPGNESSAKKINLATLHQKPKKGMRFRVLALFPQRTKARGVKLESSVATTPKALTFDLSIPHTFHNNKLSQLGSQPKTTPLWEFSNTMVLYQTIIKAKCNLNLFHLRSHLILQ